jgi:hypothetical protein
MRGYDAWRTAEPPESREAPELPHADTRHKPCGGEVRYARWDGDYYLKCEVCGGMPKTRIEESELYDGGDGCPKCAGHMPEGQYVEEHDCCVKCAGKGE